MAIYNFNDLNQAWYDELKSRLDTDLGVNKLIKTNSTNTISLKDSNWASFHARNLLMPHLLNQHIKILDYINNALSEIDDYIDNAGGLLYWNGDRNALYKGLKVKDYQERFNKLAGDYNEAMFNWRKNGDPYFNYTVQNISGDRLGGNWDNYTGSQNALRVRYLHHSADKEDFNTWKTHWMSQGAKGARLYRGFWVPILNENEIGADANVDYVNFGNPFNPLLKLSEIPDPNKAKGFDILDLTKKQDPISSENKTTIFGSLADKLKELEPLKQNKFNFLPDVIAGSRLWMALRNNRKVHDIYNKSIRPVLKNTYERYSPVTGDYAMRSFKDLQAADAMRRASLPYTADASLNTARQFEALRQANQLQTEGFLADNLRIRQTAQEALARQEDNMARRSEVANWNRLQLLDVRERRAENDALTLKANWLSIDQYAQGWEKRLRYEWEKKNTDIENWNNVIMLQNADRWRRNKEEEINNYIYKLQEKYPNGNIPYSEQLKITLARSNLEKYYTDYLYLQRAKLDKIPYKGLYTDVQRNSWIPFAKFGGKFTPKLQRGGNIVNSLAVYQDIEGQYWDLKLQQLLSGLNLGKGSQETSSKKSKSDKDTFGEKDLIDILKSAELLPNDMLTLYETVYNTLNVLALLGKDSSDIASSYLKIMPMLNNAKMYRKLYEKAYENLRNNDLIYDMAYYNGSVFAIDAETGKLASVDHRTYFKDKDRYSPITYGLLLYMTENDPKQSLNHTYLTVAQQGIGLMLINKMIKELIYNLGTLKSSMDYFGLNIAAYPKAKENESLLKTANYLQAIASYGPQGYYKMTETTESPSKEDIDALFSYVYRMLPKESLNRLIFETNNGTLEEVENLMYNMITGGINRTHNVTMSPMSGVNPDGTLFKKDAQSKKDDSPKEGYWASVMAGRGDDYTYSLLLDTGRQQVTGKIYTAVPNVDLDMSLRDWLNKSGAIQIIQDNNSISFGNIKLDRKAWDDIVIDSSSNIVTATLPKNPDGSINTTILDDYLEIQLKLKDEGYKINSPEYNRELVNRMDEIGYKHMFNAEHLPKPEFFGHFMIVEGATLNKRAIGKDPKSGDMKSFDKIESRYWINKGEDKQLAENILKALSSKESGEYEKADFGLWGNPFNNESVYVGNIYIPITNSVIKANWADNNDTKSAHAKELDEMQDEINKLNNANSTNWED